MKLIHSDGYRASTTQEDELVRIKVTRLQWELGRMETFEVPTLDDVLPFLVNGFGEGWKASKY